MKEQFRYTVSVNSMFKGETQRVDELSGNINRGVKQSELVRLDSGFLTLPETDLSNLLTEELFILVHPFHADTYVNNKQNPHYEDKRDQLLRENESPILIGIEKVRLPISTVWLKGLEPQGPRIIYLTDWANYEPTQPPKDVFIQRVKKTFNPKSIRLGGAELYLREEKLANSGCVSRTYRFLCDYFSMIVDRDYCWKG